MYNTKPCSSNSVPIDKVPEEMIHFHQEQVVVYPSKEKAIPGDLYLIEINLECFVKWIPSSIDLPKKTKKDSEKNNDLQHIETSMETSLKIGENSQAELYAIRIPVRDIYSIKRGHHPIGMRNLIIMTKSGVAFPPIYFLSGGIHEFFSSLKTVATLTRSSSDSNSHFVTELVPDIASKRNLLENFTTSISAEKLSWSLFENFSRITKYARQATKVAILGREHDKFVDPNVNEFSSEHVAHRTSIGNFEVLSEERLDQLPNVLRTSPMNRDQWNAQFDEQGRIKDEKLTRKLIFYGGIDPLIRGEVWRFLLLLFPWDSTQEQRQQILQEKRKRYYEWKSIWKLIFREKEWKFSKLYDRAHAIEKDVLRTDRSESFFAKKPAKNDLEELATENLPNVNDDNVRYDNSNLVLLNDILLTYVLFNFDLGYVQGMNEFLSPILFNVQDEADSFWCFKGLMDFMGRNFRKDQKGMHMQLDQLLQLLQLFDRPLYCYFEQHNCLNLFFCFRWLLIWFKREFSFDDIQILWDVLWSNYLSPNFHLFVALGLLLRHRKTFMDSSLEFDDIVKFINDLSGTLDVQECLIEAEKLFHHFKKICERENSMEFFNDLNKLRDLPSREIL